MYVLPNTEQCREDFEWIRSEIVALGGEATVFAADVLDASDDDLVAKFQQAREVDYQALLKDVTRMTAASRTKRGMPALNREEWSRAIRRFRERFDDIARTDFFQAPAGQETLKAVAALERRAVGAKELHPVDRPTLVTSAFRNRRWVTRPRPGVDRMASAWLIRGYIDPPATFGFVERPSGSDIPFDMYTGEFTHHGTSCTFETLVQRFNITDPAVARLSQIVHDLDMKERRYAPPEAPAVERMVAGLQEMHPDDATLLQHGIGMFEALARSFRATESAPSQRATRRTATKRSRP